MPILRYNRVSTADQSLSSQQSQADVKGNLSGLEPLGGRLIKKKQEHGTFDCN